MKTKQSIFRTALYVSVLSLVFIACNGCSKDEAEPGPGFSNEESTDFNTAVANLSGFSQPEELPAPVELSEGVPERDGALECIVKNFKASPGFDELLSLDPTTDVIYPGALLKGESIPTGEYIPITSDRAPITLSASLTNISGSPVVDIEDPKLSTVREGIKTILDQEVTGATPARVSFEITQVYTEQQLNVAIGANYRSAGQKVSAAIDFSNTTKRNKFVLKYLQTYYTIDMDLPNDPSDLFNSLPDLSVLGSTAPVFVSSVAYGRMVIYTIETNSSETEINAALSATFASGDGTVDAGFKQTIDESTIKGLIIGGSGSGAAQAINGPSEVYAFISEGGDYSRDSPGAPLAYKLRFIKKGTPVARIVLSTEYPIRNCDLAYPRFRVTINNISRSSGGDMEIYGYIGARLWSNGDWVRSNPDNPGVDDAYWSTNRDNTVDVSSSKTHAIGITEVIEPYKPDYQLDYVNIYGKLTDKDLFSDDELGDLNINIPLEDIEILADGDERSGLQTLNFQQNIEVEFTVERID